MGASAVLGLALMGVSACGGTDSAPAAVASAAPSPESTADLSTLIAAEDAAIYAYGVIGAHLSGGARAQAIAALTAHRRLRDDWIAIATKNAQDIPSAAIAYDLPINVRGRTTALELSREIETRMIEVYTSAGDTAAEALAKARARLSRLTSSG